ncbi:28S ribosomal protein S5, mitochondrial [Aplysia californica]|uniref:Small ribosomal subunit protein uS5m n=1 Tax=Aplysia californica TaxID=6500 RepID=A0ABM0JT66_APLCA|nr:28S ribosomal protein S5, mitochondrial [Aplysia californica]
MSFKMAATSVYRVLACSRSKLLTPFVCRGVSPNVSQIAARQLTLISVRCSTSFVGKVTANELWEGVTSVSNAGRKRGRGKSVKRKLDLNRGQRIGMGKSGMVFPGLTGPALVGKKLVDIHQVKPQEEEETAAPVIPKRKTLKIPALQRGYSGRKYPGTSIGSPDPINDYVFEDFDTKVLEYKMVSHMTGNLGRKMRVSTLVVTGNKQGLAGYAVAKSPMGKAALRKAKNMAGQRLQFIELYEGHTVFHNFAVTEGRTKIFVEKMPKGYGLDCHRIIKTICEIIGIQDLQAKVEGSDGNVQNICKGFFRGLMEQETHQSLADRVKLHVVEFRPELENVPVVVASPSHGEVNLEPIKEEAFDFDNMYYEDGKIPLKKAEDPLRLHRQTEAHWRTYLKNNRDRNQVQARYQRMIYGLEPSSEELKQRAKPLK